MIRFLANLCLGLIFCFLFFQNLLTASNSPKPQNTRVILRIGTTNQVKSANILLDSSLSLFAHVSNPTLMKMSTEVHPEVQLLQKIESSPDQKTWTLVLKDNLFWSDGTPVTSKDIGFTLAYLKNNYPAGGWIKSILEDVRIRDRLTVNLQLNRPYARLDFEFTTYPLLPKHIWEKIENPMRYTNPGPNIGCGPFVIQKVDLIRGVVVMEKNPFWQGSQPHIQGLEIHLFNNRDVLALSLEKGDVDIFYEYAASYPYPNISRLQKNPDFVFLNQLNLGLHFLGFNLNKQPMTDREFRRAISYAIDYAEIAQLIALGHAQPPRHGFIPPPMPAQKPSPIFAQDRQRALAMLQEAGYRDADHDGNLESATGQELRLKLLVNPLKPYNARLAELLREYFFDIGIHIEIKAVEGSSWVNLKDKYRYDLVLSRTTPWGMLMHASWATGYFDARRTGEGVLHTVDDPKFLSLCDALLTTTDPGEQQKLAYDVQDYYSENLPALPLLWNEIITPCNKRFVGWKLDPLYGLYNIDTLLNVRRQTP
jgi:peptide/nickel transport system substrate-binding protein